MQTFERSVCTSLPPDGEEEDFIIRGVFMDDFANIPTSQSLKGEFETLYSRAFEVTGGGAMTSLKFLGLEVEQEDSGEWNKPAPGYVH
jgi:hypothetical protein